LHILNAVDLIPLRCAPNLKVPGRLLPSTYRVFIAREKSRPKFRRGLGSGMPPLPLPSAAAIYNSSWRISDRSWVASASAAVLRPKAEAAPRSCGWCAAPRAAGRSPLAAAYRRLCDSDYTRRVVSRPGRNHSRQELSPYLLRMNVRAENVRRGGCRVEQV